MVFDISVAMSWLLFLALFPIAFFWLRRAWRIGIRRDFSEVAMKHGVPPPNAARYAVFDLALNLIGGAIVVVTVLAIVFNGLAYEHWSAIAGSTIWLKLILDFALSRHAHWGLDKTQ